MSYSYLEKKINNFGVNKQGLFFPGDAELVKLSVLLRIKSNIGFPLVCVRGI